MVDAALVGHLSREDEFDFQQQALAPLVEQLMDLDLRIEELEAELFAWHRSSEESRRLGTIPGVGVIIAKALAVAVTVHFHSGREFAAWLGLTPRQNSSGGKERLGRIARMGDGYLRSLLVVGATAVMRYARKKPSWVSGLLARKPARLVSVALANKMARIAWSLLARNIPIGPKPLPLLEHRANAAAPRRSVREGVTMA